MQIFHFFFLNAECGENIRLFDAMLVEELYSKHHDDEPLLVRVDLDEVWKMQVL